MIKFLLLLLISSPLFAGEAGANGADGAQGPQGEDGEHPEHFEVQCVDGFLVGSDGTLIYFGRPYIRVQCSMEEPTPEESEEPTPEESEV